MKEDALFLTVLSFAVGLALSCLGQKHDAIVFFAACLIIVGCSPEKKP